MGQVGYVPYPTYEEALALCSVAAYEGPYLVEVVVEKNRLAAERHLKNPMLELSAFPTLAAFSCFESGHLKVLDFGGGGGNQTSKINIGSKT